jgi:predicted ATPase
MLRQVAYDTLSLRDRKARHLTVAAHLRAAFPGGGDEVAEVIARHYLDALDAVPDDHDTAQIRRQAVQALIQAAERAERTGAPALATASYAAAAGLIPPDAAEGTDTADARPSPGGLWERAARAADTSAGWAAAVEHAGRARDY